MSTSSTFIEFLYSDIGTDRGHDEDKERILKILVANTGKK
jgi:hypothetical protein